MSDSPKCEDCGWELVKGELDRSGQSYWCPVCTKAGLRVEENKRLRTELSAMTKRAEEAEREVDRYREKADAIHKYLVKKNDKAILAVVTELSLDAQMRADAARGKNG